MVFPRIERVHLMKVPHTLRRIHLSIRLASTAKAKQNKTWITISLEYSFPNFENRANKIEVEKLLEPKNQYKPIWFILCEFHTEWNNSRNMNFKFFFSICLFHRRYILSPFGKSLGIKSTRSKRAAPNPILEAAYNKCSRIHHKTVSCKKRPGCMYKYRIIFICSAFYYISMWHFFSQVLVIIIIWKTNKNIVFYFVSDRTHVHRVVLKKSSG